MHLSRVLYTLPCALLLAQAPPPQINPAAQPDLQSFLQTVRTLRRTSSAADDVKTKVDALLAHPSRREVANAYALLTGQSWDERQEFAWSLVLRPGSVIADSSLPLVAHLAQTYPATLKSARGLKLRLEIQEEGANKPLRKLAEYEFPVRDLIEQPFGIEADLKGWPDGVYTMRTELLDNDAPAFQAEARLQLVNGLQAGRTTLESRLARIQGHDGTKASIRYPYVLAQIVNTGRRQWNAADFGLPYEPQLPYDFVAGIRKSRELLAVLESGKDVLYRAKGDHERHYWFEEAREMMAYHVYAPVKWDGKSSLPMVLVLHGNTRDQDYYFDRDDHILARLAEQRGYLVVCPMGYRPNAGWGSSSLNGGRGRGGDAADPSRLRQGELSEQDALHVLDMVTKEYPVDPARIYLFGHSAGGGGTWYLGQKYAGKWAAIAASAAPTRPDSFPFARLKGVPTLVCHGDKDDEVPVTSSRNMVKAARENGLDPEYIEVPGATHLTIVAIVEPKVFEFFDRHPGKNRAQGD